MKVAFISQPIDYVGPHQQGSSIAIWTDRVMRALQPEGFDFQVYAKRFQDQPAIETVDGITFRRVPVQLEERLARPFKLAERLLGYPWRKRPFFASGLSFAGYAWQAARLIRQNPVDIVHIHNYSQLVPPIRALNPRVKIALHMHCEWLTQLDRRLINQRLQQVDLIIGCSDYITDLVRRQFPQHASRCRAVYNGVDTALFTPNERLAKDASQPFKVIFVGRISPEKGLHILLDAFQRVITVCPTASLDIIGAPGSAPYDYIALISEDPAVRQLSSYYHGINRRSGYFSDLKASLSPTLADRVTFTGPLSHHALAERYREADLLVNPSLSEAFGMSLIEGMSSGLPVAAARVGGMSEIVREGQTGRLVDANDPAQLGDAIIHLLRDAPLRQQMGAAGRARALDCYRWEQVATCLGSDYRSLEIEDNA